MRARRFLRLREIDGGWILRVGRFEIIYGGRFFDLVKPHLLILIALALVVAALLTKLLEF
jgi:hypothetical protein